MPPHDDFWDNPNLPVTTFEETYLPGERWEYKVHTTDGPLCRVQARHYQDGPTEEFDFWLPLLVLYGWADQAREGSDTVGDL